MLRRYIQIWKTLNRLNPTVLLPSQRTYLGASVPPSPIRPHSTSRIRFWPTMLNREQRGYQKSYPGGDHYYIGCVGQTRVSWVAHQWPPAHNGKRISARSLLCLLLIAFISIYLSIYLSIYIYISFILVSRADSLLLPVIQHAWLAFHSAFLTLHRSGVLTALTCEDRIANTSVLKPQLSKKRKKERKKLRKRKKEKKKKKEEEKKLGEPKLGNRTESHPITSTMPYR